MTKSILFVCIENSCRSQIAEAFAKIYGNNKIESFSAGSKPSGQVNPMAMAYLKSIEYEFISNIHSKSLKDLQKNEFDFVISMGCGDACPFVVAKIKKNWSIPDPKDMSMDDFVGVAEIIRDKVKEFIEKLENV
jgi:protein-tyrosine-phosphatase